MQYAKLNTDGTYAYQITTSGNVQWDETHNCPASDLTAEEAIFFCVVPLLETPQPVFNPITQAMQRNGGELVEGKWQYKWDITTLDAATVASNLSAAKVAFIAQVKADAGTLTQQALAGLESEYELAEKEATEYKAAGYPATPVPSSVQDEIESKAAKGITVTATEACDVILAAAVGWRSAQATLRRKRLAIAGAAHVAVDGARLDVLKKQWINFMSNLYNNLKIPQNSFRLPIQDDGIIEVTVL